MMRPRVVSVLKRSLLSGALLSALAAAACRQAASNPPPPVNNQAAVARSAPVTTQGVLLTDIPEKIDPQARYLFFLHGKMVEDKGVHPVDKRFGVYEYEKILDAFKGEGFTVISEARSKGTDVEQYAGKVAGQINSLLKAGVTPQRITVLGASKGAIIAMLTSTLLKNRDVNFVLMDNCNRWVDRHFHINLYGNVLSLYDADDQIGGTCRRFFEKAGGLNKNKEVVLRTGLGHGVLYKPLREWVDLAASWARQD